MRMWIQELRGPADKKSGVRELYTYSVEIVAGDEPRCLDIARERLTLDVVSIGLGDQWRHSRVVHGEMRHEYRCARCGGVNVSHAMWVDLNTDEVGDVFGSWCEDDSSSCADCEEEGIQILDHYVHVTPREQSPIVAALVVAVAAPDYHAELVRAGWRVETEYDPARECYEVMLVNNLCQHVVHRDTLAAALQAAWAGESDENERYPERDL